MNDQPRAAEDDDVDFDKLAIDQAKKLEPDELDGPAWNLDRRLDDENPQDGS
jgi:hypothetical protein